ncbi:MAG: hypothetical protein GX320_01395 [Tissierellia bacterium]|nr:hypothetical protein [Tissierellia bacterium]
MTSNSFIPTKMGNLIIIDGRVSQEMLKNIKKLNLNVVPTIKCIGVPEPISYHPDIVIHPINHNTLVIAPNVFDYYEEKLWGMGIKMIRGETELGKNYPDHVAYNVGRVGNLAIHNLKYTDEILKYFLKKENIEFIHVNQGYTKCSMMIVDTNAGITADYPMYKKLRDIGIDMLLINPGHVDLEGYPYGFIGGASGNLSQEDIILSGRLDKHPDKDKIFKFLKRYKKRVIYLSNEKIIDIGTIISLYSQ